MAEQEITEEVRRFIQTTINSVDQLEVLLFLMSNADKEWTAEEIGKRIRVAPATVAEKLEELHRARLLSVQKLEALCYRYAPSSKALETAVAESLNRAYYEQRESVIQLIYTRPLENIKIFADAFRIKKEGQ